MVMAIFFSIKYIFEYEDIILEPEEAIGML